LLQSSISLKTHDRKVAIFLSSYEDIPLSEKRWNHSEVIGNIQNWVVPTNPNQYSVCSSLLQHEDQFGARCYTSWLICIQSGMLPIEMAEVHVQQFHIKTRYPIVNGKRQKQFLFLSLSISVVV
jgi:hypothetical protein